MFKKSSLSVVGLVCIAIWTLGLAGCKDSNERAAGKQLMNATRQADELCRAAMAELANPSEDKNVKKATELLDSARAQLNAALKETSQYAGELAEQVALAKSSLAQIENIDAQYKFMIANRQLTKCYSMMSEIFNTFAKAQSAAAAAETANQQTAFDTSAFAEKMKQNDDKLKETRTRLKNISAALDEKKTQLADLSSQMEEMSVKSQKLLGESKKLPAGKSGAKLDEALAINGKIGEMQRDATKIENESASLAMLIESLELKVKNLEDYGKMLQNSQKTMNELAVESKARADILENATADARKKLTDKCAEFRTMQKELCDNAEACQNGFEKSADMLKRALMNASEEFKNSMQLKQAELALAAASIELDMIAYKKQAENLQAALNKGGMNIVVTEDLKGLSAESLANAAATNCQDAISIFERSLRSTPSKGKWRMHSAMASANVTLSRALRAAGKTSLADSALKTAEAQLKEARDKSQWLAKSSLDAIEKQIKQAK